jgi:hypothetical protein
MREILPSLGQMDYRVVIQWATFVRKEDPLAWISSLPSSTAQLRAVPSQLFIFRPTIAKQ